LVACIPTDPVSDRPDVPPPHIDNSNSNDDDTIVVDPEPEPEPEPEPVPPPFVLDGTYEGTQVWDLGSALHFEDGPGTVVADAVVSAIVDASGLPSYLTSAAKPVVEALVHEPISTFVNNTFSGTTILDDMASAVGSVEVETRIELALGDDGMTVTGSEEILSMTVQGVEIPMVAINTLMGYDVTDADVNGEISEDESTLTVDTHEYRFRSDAILSIAGVDVLGYETLESALDSILDCEAMVDYMTDGAGSLSFGVSGYNKTIGFDSLMGICADARGYATDYVLDYFRRDFGVATGGTVSLADENQDGAVDELHSADYVGNITLLPLDPEFDIDFTASRQ
jgi:hypothetical protein